LRPPRRKKEIQSLDFLASLLLRGVSFSSRKKKGKRVKTFTINSSQVTICKLYRSISSIAIKNR
jgi:hypothetical protein